MGIKGRIIFSVICVAQQKYILIANLTHSVTYNKKYLGAVPSCLVIRNAPSVYETPFLPEGNHPSSEAGSAHSEGYSLSTSHTSFGKRRGERNVQGSIGLGDF